MALIGSQIARGTGPTGLRSTPDWIRMFSTVVRLTPTSPATYRAERPDWYSSTTRWRTRLVARRFVMTGLSVIRAAGGRSSTGVLGVY